MPDAHDLVSLMTAREPDLRPSAGEVCKHPFFWNEEKRLSFLLEFSDRLEQVGPSVFCVVRCSLCGGCSLPAMCGSLRASLLGCVSSLCCSIEMTPCFFF